MSLKPLVETDLKVILPWHNSEAVRRNMYGQYEISVSEHRAWFGALAIDPSRQCYVFFDETDTANGVVYFTDINPRQGTACWGFYARPGAKAGIGLRIGLEALDIAFSTLKLYKLNGEVLSTNRANINISKKLGFHEEGCLRDQHNDGFNRVDIIRFGMVRAEWGVAREKLLIRIGLLDEKATKSQKNTQSGAGYIIVILSDESSWINSFLFDLELDFSAQGHNVISACNIEDALASLNLLKREAKDSNKTCLCFCLSFSKILSAEFRGNFQHTLVVHESGLPNGKGWSPFTWQVLEGKMTIPVCLIEAADQVDSGKIYAREIIQLNGHELVDELREAQAEATMNLCTAFVEHFPHSVNNEKKQTGDETFYSRRRPEDSRLDPKKSILEQFNLLRTVDNDRYPAFFDFKSRRYYLKISAAQKHD